MIDPHLVKLMPDQALSAAIQNPNGSVPSWLALAELQSRNQLRASAPVQQPQGTVAQNVVGQALRSAGLPMSQPSGGIAPSAPMAQQQGGIASAPTGMAKGGIVQHLAGGGQPSLDDVFSNLGILPDQPDLTATQTQYHPTYTPDGTTLDQAAAKVTPLYGQGPDYQSTLNDIAALRQQSAANSKVGLGSWLTNLVGGIMSGKGTATQNFGAALQEGDQLERALAQQNIGNQSKLIGDKLNVQRFQDARQQQIAEAAQKYQGLNAQIADTQSKMQFENDRGNADRADEMARTNASLREQRAKILGGMTEAIGSNPIFAKTLANEAARRGDNASAQLLNDAAAQHMQNLQQQQDIKTRGEMQVEGARSANQMRAIMAEKALEHQYKMQEMGMDPNNPQGSIEQEAQLLAHYHLHPLSPMSLTRPQAGAIMRRVSEINPNYDGSYYDAINQMRKEALPNGKIGNVATAANTAIAHLDVLGQASDALNNGNIQAFNSVAQKWAQATGKPAPTNFDALKHQVSGELVSILKKNGVADEHSIEAIQNNLDRANSPAQMGGVINQNLRILGGKVSEVLDQAKKTPGLAPDDPVMNQLGYSDAAKQSLYHRGFDPQNVQAGPVLAGLPAGKGNKIDSDTMKKFLKATGNKNDAMRVAYDFGWR